MKRSIKPSKEKGDGTPRSEFESSCSFWIEMAIV